MNESTADKSTANESTANKSTANTSTSSPSDLARYWQLEPELDFLNHGSFGACPTAVLEEQSRWRAQLESQPVAFLGRGRAELVDHARSRLAAFVGADPANIVPVTNATAGVNAVLHSLGFHFRSGDEILLTDHTYNACHNALRTLAQRHGLQLRVVPVPFPVTGPNEVVERFVSAATARTRLALIDHVTSVTGLVLPIAELVSQLQERGVDVLVDGAHGPGMVELELEDLGAAYYTGNCHKWMCSPKSAGLLYVRPDRQELIHPLVISHGSNIRRVGRSLFHDEFDLPGTIDWTAFLSVPAVIDYLDNLVPGGWPEIRRRNRELALAARAVLARVLDIEPPCPDAMIGSLAALPVPGWSYDQDTPNQNPITERLVERHRIEAMFSDWPALGQTILRVSAQLYNDISQYERLAAVLPDELSDR